LAVEAPSSAVILLQPSGDTVVEGGYFALSVTASGPPPLLYQWFRNGDTLFDATNSRLVFVSVQAVDAGTYSVLVSSGSTNAVESLPATLAVVPALDGGGWLRFDNRPPIDAPVFDVDGTTRIAGSNYLAQLYAGLTTELLRPAGEPRRFGSSGFILPSMVRLPNVPPGTNAFAQVRAWAAHSGATSYEEARATGGRFGRSAILPLYVGEPLTAPGLVGLQSFRLQAGVPHFTVGLLHIVERREDGSIEWAIEGEAGFRYLIERATNAYLWKPLLVLTNVSGRATFVDPAPPADGSALYRSRLLD
jgi:hypothetical protein